MYEKKRWLRSTVDKKEEDLLVNGKEILNGEKRKKGTCEYRVRGEKREERCSK